MARVFLSYSHADQDVARQIATWLRATGASVWIDDVEIGVGESLLNRIAAGIQDSDFVVSLLSRTSVESSWVRKELSLAQTKGINSHQVVVLPVRIDDCDVPFELSDVFCADLSDKSKLHAEMERVARSIGVSIKGSSLDHLYVANDWRTVLMVRTFANRREWRHPPYDIVGERRPLKRILSVFGSRTHPVASNEAERCVEAAVQSCLKHNPDFLGLGGMGKTAQRIEAEVRRNNSEVLVDFWGRDAHIDAAGFLRRLNVQPPY